MIALVLAAPQPSTAIGAELLALAVVCGVAYAFVQNLRLGHYEIVHDHRPNDRVRIAFDVLATAVRPQPQVRRCEAYVRRRLINSTQPAARRAIVRAGVLSAPAGSAR